MPKGVSRPVYTREFKIRAAKHYLKLKDKMKDAEAVKKTAEKFKVGQSSLHKWLFKYKNEWKSFDNNSEKSVEISVDDSALEELQKKVSDSVKSVKPVLRIDAEKATKTVPIERYQEVCSEVIKLTREKMTLLETIKTLIP